MRPLHLSVAAAVLAAAVATPARSAPGEAQSMRAVHLALVFAAIASAAETRAQAHRCDARGPVGASVSKPCARETARVTDGRSRGTVARETATEKVSADSRKLAHLP